MGVHPTHMNIGVAVDNYLLGFMSHFTYYCVLSRPVRIMLFFQPIMLCSNSFQISLLCFQISLLCFVVLPIMLKL